MAHVRQQLRSAVAAALANLPATGTRVDSAPMYPLDLAAGPRLAIVITDEAAEVASIHSPPVIQRSVNLVVEVHAAAAAGLADTLDTAAAQVEAALGAAVTVSGVAVPLAYRGASIEFSTDGELPVGRLALTYSADLFTAANNAEALAQA